MTLQRADVCDTTSLVETRHGGLTDGSSGGSTGGRPELIADLGYHSNSMLVDLQAVGVRNYIAEPVAPLMRKAFGRGTPRGLQGRRVDVGAVARLLSPGPFTKG